MKLDKLFEKFFFFFKKEISELEDFGFISLCCFCSDRKKLV